MTRQTRPEQEAAADREAQLRRAKMRRVLMPLFSISIPCVVASVAAAKDVGGIAAHGLQLPIQFGAMVVCFAAGGWFGVVVHQRVLREFGVI